MDQELIAYLDERFRESARHAESLHQENMQQITGLHLETNQRFEKMEERQDRTETEIRRAQVMVEGLRGEIQLVAEGVSGLGEKQRSFRREVAQKFDLVQKSIAPYYRDLDGRLRILEEWAECEGKVSVDVIRQRHRKPL